LRWLGSSTVLALGGSALSACMGESRETQRPRDGGGSEASSLGFQPGSGEGAIFDDWNERTVDPQNLADILADWTLTVDGLVASPLTLGFAELLALERQEQVTDFHCVEGWSVYDVPWQGVKLSRVLDLAGADTAATHVTFHSIGEQYGESLPMPVARESRTLLGYGVGGSTLPLAHGFPLRLVVPLLLGYKNSKYLLRVEGSDHPVTGYWETFGYPYDGEVPASRLRPDKYQLPSGRPACQMVGSPWTPDSPRWRFATPTWNTKWRS
jgi:DMSO/TMAO reductase YedYZ molybdopterin-dependent catalytic subunit